MAKKTTYHGIDISVLEGWLVKYNSKEKFFGSSSNKRWFKVDVANPEDDVAVHRLILSYYKNKKTKEMRGWIYLENVTKINVKPSLIEIVSPSRTLRVKGETAAEHKLWADSLQTLRFPPPPVPLKSSTIVPSSLNENYNRLDEAERLVQAQPKTNRDVGMGIDAKKAVVESKRAPNVQEKPRVESKAPSPPKPIRVSEETKSTCSEEKRSEPLPVQIREESKHSEFKNVDDSDEEDEPPSTTSTLTRTNSILQRKEIEFSDSEDEDEDDAPSSPPSTKRSNTELLQATKDNESAIQRADRDSSSEDEYHDAEWEYLYSQASPMLDREPERNRPSQAQSPMANNSKESDETKDDEVTSFELTPKSKPKEYFDDDEQSDDEECHNQIPSKTTSSYFDDDEQSTPKDPVALHPISTVAADNNFVTEDWDADDEPVAAPVVQKAPPIRHSGGVTADSNFVHENWDD